MTEGAAGTINFKRQVPKYIMCINEMINYPNPLINYLFRTLGLKTLEKTISLGEEHSETLPNGEIAQVECL